MINLKRSIGTAVLATMLMSGAAFAATPGNAPAAQAGATAKANRAAKAAERPELQAWKQAHDQGMNLRDQMKTQHQTNKETAAQVKENLKNDPAKAEALKSEMAPVKEQAKSLRDRLKAGRDELKALWQQFRTAFKSGDQATMDSVGQQLAEKRTAQNGVLQQFFDLMKQRLSILNNYK
jgi:chromosome segregation ATPase